MPRTSSPSGGCSTRFRTGRAETLSTLDVRARGREMTQRPTWRIRARYETRKRAAWSLGPVGRRRWSSSPRPVAGTRSSTLRVVVGRECSGGVARARELHGGSSAVERALASAAGRGAVARGRRCRVVGRGSPLGFESEVRRGCSATPALMHWMNEARLTLR
jgi:hypothetical protein